MAFNLHATPETGRGEMLNLAPDRLSLWFESSQRITLMAMSCWPEMTYSAGGSSFSSIGESTVGVKPPVARSLLSVATKEGGRFGISSVPMTAPVVMRKSLQYRRSFFFIL